MDMIKTIGNTPLIKIKYEYEGKTNYIYTKLESYNLTGSIKDRAAYYITILPLTFQCPLNPRLDFSL